MAGERTPLVPRSPRSVWRRLAWAIGLALLVLVAATAILVGPYLFAPNQYAGVPSIERRADYRDPALMAAAWALPVARAYRRGFEYQTNPSYCGPASIANLLRSTGARSSQEAVLDGTRYEPWFGVLLGGLTLDEAADLLRQRSGTPVAIVRDPTLAAFIGWMRQANDPSRRLIVNFHRGPMFGRGHGHFSPVLAYLADRDLVLVGDVNADYRPYLVSSERLWRATDTVDAETGEERGLIVATIARSGAREPAP